MSQNLDTAAARTAPAGTHEQHTGKRLSAFLCWAVVFADIGTSVYYVPGILYGNPEQGTGVGDLAGLFVMMTVTVFVLLSFKYSEVSVRFPEGGGVVTVAARGLNPWAGAVGGMFILVDYFLTSAISSLSGVQYFETLVPALSSLVLQLSITLILVALLGLLNWYGIKESAVVSALIACAAFVSDIVILLLIALKVPPSVIGDVFRLMLSGHNLTVPIILTGYAGAFLAFSGLESISQLSPVMALPRSKTVTRALALVVLTVGITSPLLTIFSTTLLTHPELLARTDLIPPHVTTMPSLANQFISQLGYSAGGRILEVATAVTASTLLLFASNTAIIGAYHVFLALSRMQFFPNIVERKDWRGSPWVAIFLATIVPMLVLIGVRGRIDLLGDMYAFGLLGAFSLTCLALDVIRVRERHGSLPVNSHDEAEEIAAQATAAGESPSLDARIRAVWQERLTPQARERLRGTAERLGAQRAALARITAPTTHSLRAVWPDIKYYLGFVTTVLVGAAWMINLRTKPLATIFGGGLTVLGVAISVVNYRYQQSRGVAPVIPEYYLRPLPGSLLVVLDPRSPNNAAVVRAACQSAQGHPLVILALGHPELREVRAFEIAVPYFNDVPAQQTLSLAASICRRERVPAHYVYRVDTPNAVLDAWRIIQPDEIIAEAELAKTITKRVSPDTVRIQRSDGIKVVHALKRRVSPLEAAGRERPARRGAAEAAGRQAEAITAPPGALAATPSRELSPFTVPPALPPASHPAGAPGPNGTKPAERRPEETPPPEGQRAEVRSTEPVAAPSAALSAPPAPTPPAATEETPVESVGESMGEGEGEEPIQPQTGAAPSNVDLDQYVWTGTDYVRLDELDEAEREALEGERNAGPGGDDRDTGGQADVPDADEHADA